MTDREKARLLAAAEAASRFAAQAFAALDDADGSSTYARANRRHGEGYTYGMAHRSSDNGLGRLTAAIDNLSTAKPVVAVTANAMAGQRDECLRSGCDAFLTKPIDVPALYDLLARTLVSEQPSSTS